MELDNDPEVMKYLTNGKTSTSDEIFDVIKRVELLYKKYQHHFGIWAAIEKKSHQFMGWFLLRPCKKDPDNLQVLELGYRLKNSFGDKALQRKVHENCLIKLLLILK